MDGLDKKNGVDITFRQNVLTNVIIKNIKERYSESDDPEILTKFIDLAVKFEKRMFINATSMDDYLDKVVQKLNMMEEGELVDTLEAPTVVSAAIASLPDADWKLLIDQYRRARSMYMPEVIKELKRAEEQWFQRQKEGQLETGLRSKIAYYQRIIIFFHIPENELLRLSREKLRYTLNYVLQYLNPLSRTSTTPAGNQGPQSAYGQIHPNNMQMTPSEYVMSINKPMSWMQENESSHSETCAPHLPLDGSPHATKRVDMKTLQHQSTEHLNVKQNLQLTGSETMNQPQEIRLSRKPQKLLDKKADFMNSMFPPMTKATSRRTKTCLQSPGACLMSAKLPLHFSAQTEKKKNTSCALDPRAMLQPKPTISTVDSPLTPITPSTAHREIGKPTKSISPMEEFRARKSQCETEVQDKFLILETQGVLASSSLASDSSGPESNQLPHCAKLPFERLVQAFQLISEEVPRSSLDDIASAMNAVNELPMYANDFDSEYSPAIYCSTGDGYTPQRKMKCDTDSVTGVASTLDNHGSCRKKPRKEVNNDLMNEIREINQRLIETVLEVDFDSDSSKGTIIKCTYKPVPYSENYKRHFASMESLAILLIEILVPPEYPHTPLQILDRLPVGCCIETKNLMEKAKSRFCCVLASRGLMSLGDMAQAWDDSVRSVFTDFALSRGGESFSSKYGTWECVPAV